MTELFSNSYMAYAMIAVGIFTFYMAVINLLRTGGGNDRLKNTVETTYEPELTETHEPTSSAFTELMEKTLSTFKYGAFLRPDAQKEVTQKLMLAGLTSAHAITYYLFFKNIVQPVILIIGLIVGYKGATSGAETTDLLLYLIVAGILVLLGLKGADIYVANARQKRVALLTDSFPEVMDLLLVCIESGLGLDAALNRVCKELRDMHPAVIAELDRTRLELSMLGDRVIALQNLADRTGTMSFNTLVSALVQTEKFGTSLIDTLRVLSEEQRLTRLYAAEQKAARIPVLVTIPLILFIMPAFIMIILGPPIIKIIEQGGLFSGQ